MVKKRNKSAEDSALPKTLINSFIYSGDNAASENKGIKIVLWMILFAAAVIAKSVMDLKDEYRAIVVPSWTTESMQVTGSTANQFYLEEMAEYLSHLYGNISPSDVRQKLDMIMRLAHPSQFDSLKEQMGDRAEAIEKLKTTVFSSRLVRERGIFTRKDFRSEYTGVKQGDVQQLQFSAQRVATIDGKPESSQLQHFNVDYTIERGRFYLLGYYEVKSHAR